MRSVWSRLRVVPKSSRLWGARLGLSEMTGYQASARGGHVRIELAGERVRLGGKAVTVLKGKLEGGLRTED